MKEDTTDYKQLAYKLQSDLEHQKWEQAHRDLPFLKEMKDKLLNGERDYVISMVEDWISDLEKILNKD